MRNRESAKSRGAMGGRFDAESRSLHGWAAYAVAALTVAGTTAAAALARAWLAESDIVILYLLTIILLAFSLGRGPSLLAAALSVASFDFFFVLPFLTFSIEQTRHVLTFVMMFGVGVATSELMSRLRNQEERARRRERQAAALYALTRDLAGLDDERDVVACAARHAAQVFGGPSSVSLERESGSPPCEAAGVPDASGETRRTARGGGAVAKLVRLELDASAPERVTFSIHGPTSDGERAFLRAFARQVALAVERVGLARVARLAALRARAEEERNSLL
ncbi:MAG: DUF4118 domain-containing protein, partial [Candidatus Bipolaricaulota bacterium]